MVDNRCFVFILQAMLSASVSAERTQQRGETSPYMCVCNKMCCDYSRYNKITMTMKKINSRIRQLHLNYYHCGWAILDDECALRSIAHTHTHRRHEMLIFVQSHYSSAPNWICCSLWWKASVNESEGIYVESHPDVHFVILFSFNSPISSRRRCSWVLIWFCRCDCYQIYIYSTRQSNVSVMDLHLARKRQ